MTTDIKTFIENFGFLLAQELAKSAPKDTGILSKSFPGTFKMINDTRFSYTVPKYFKYVEFGSGLLTSAEGQKLGIKKQRITPKKSKALKFQKGGETIIVKSVKGQQPQFFLRDTVFRKSKDLIEQSLIISNR